MGSEGYELKSQYTHKHLTWNWYEKNIPTILLTMISICKMFLLKKSRLRAFIWLVFSNISCSLAAHQKVF